MSQKVIKVDEINEKLTYELGTYLEEISQKKILPDEKINELYLQYRNGNLEAGKAIIEANLRYVVNWAKYYVRKRNLTHLSVLDLIQEGNVGLVKSLNYYNPTISSFKAYSCRWIRKEMTSAIYMKETEIQSPERFRIDFFHLQHLENEYKKLYDRDPNEEEILKDLNITSQRLEAMRSALNFSFIDLDELESEEVQTFLSEDMCDHVLNQVWDCEILTVLKYFLSEKEYYVLYWRILSETPKTNAEIANILGTAKQRISQIEKKTLKKIQSFLEDRFWIRESYDQIKKIEKERLKKMQLAPVEVDKIFLYQFLKTSLSYNEAQLYQLLYFDSYQYSMEEMCLHFHMTEEAFSEFYGVFLEKIKHYDPEEYETFSSELREEYKTEIFKLYPREVKLLEKKRK